MSSNMFRVRWQKPTTFVLFILLLLFFMPCSLGECWYKAERYTEGAEVTTPEPCLNCTCNKGALLCYLRVCPTLPNPPPSGCILLHKFETCCPELICSDGHKHIEARSDPDELNLLGESFTPEGGACVLNGSVYGPGSAMDSSTLCEYCYCLGGKQTCVTPKCLLPIENCLPKYDPTNCCPAYYECNYGTSTTSTTTRRSTTLVGKNRGGCTVDGIYYKEGEKVLGAGHSECDNCYCLRGVLRCEPLACAPPLFGCTPVIRAGECCAISYNCSGVIEINPEPNYGQVPIVSKQYAKFHKEIQQPLLYEEAAEQKLIENSHSLRYDSVQMPTAKIKKKSDFESTLMDEILFGTEKNSTSLGVSLIDDRFNRKIESNEKNSVEEELTTTAHEEITTDFVQTTAEYSTFTEEYLTETTPNTVETDTEITSHVVTVQTVLNSTDCIKTSDPFQVEQYSDNLAKHATSVENNKENNATITATPNAVNNIELDLETAGERNSSIDPLGKDTLSDYDFDYNEPTLPPSLPNLRIIPFLAADALDLKKSENEAIHATQEQVTDSFMSYNLFSPPVETEGGFVPKEPPILNNIYENSVASTTDTSKILNCFFENREVVHGELVSSESPCDTCRCFYGNVICQKIKCSGPQLGCERSIEQDSKQCCPHYVCDNEVPVDRIDIDLNPKETVPAPPTLSFYLDGLFPTSSASDVEKISISSTKTSTVFFTEDQEPGTSLDLKISSDDSPRDKIVNFLYSASNLTSRDSLPPTAPTAFKTEGKRSDAGQRYSAGVSSTNVAVLKLAGCNIYGRMYRVGRIISELSNPCLECKCTEIGVQCKALNC